MSKFQVGDQAWYVGNSVWFYGDVPVTITEINKTNIRISQGDIVNHRTYEEYLVPIKKFNQAPKLP